MSRPLIALGVCVLLVGCGGREADAPDAEPGKSPGRQLPGRMKPDGQVYSSPKMSDVVKGAGAAANGKKVVIGNVRITLPEPPANQAKVELDFRVLQTPGPGKIFRCHIRAGSGELLYLDIPPTAAPDDKDRHTVHTDLVTPEFLPPFTVVVDEFDVGGGRDTAVPVSNTVTVR